MRAASELVAEIGDRFKAGDAAPERIASLTALIATLELQLARFGTVPDDLKADIASLLALVQATTTAGGLWLAAVVDGPELANYHMRARVQKVYSVPIRDDSPP